MFRAVLAVVLLAALGACAATHKAPATAPDPAVALAAAVARLDGQNVRYTLGDAADRYTGAYDATAGAHAISGASDGEEFDLVVAGKDLYVGGLTDLGGKHLHYDVRRLAPDHALLIMTDPLAARTFLGAVGELRRAAPGGFTGTFDLTRVNALNAVPARRIADRLAGAAGAGVTAVAFTAAVDGQGRLTEFTATFPKADDGADLGYVLKIVEYGAAVTVAVPAPAMVVEAPATAY